MSPPQVPEDGLPSYTREEVAQHKKSTDCWVILHGQVYDVTKWLGKHPGGARLIMHYAGQDATLAWTSFHHNKAMVRKYLAQYHIGKICPEQKELQPIEKDFLTLRDKMETKEFFKTSPLFFVAHFLHIVLFYFAAWGTLWYFGNNWITWLAAAALTTVSQAQAGWLQHDFGHHTVFDIINLNRALHHVVIGLMKGVSSFWWNYRHYQHHAKPNVYLKDPDITIPYVVLLGKIIPEKWGKKRWGTMPYHFQQHYFFLIGPPLLLPIYFHVEVLFYVLKKRKWIDFVCMLIFYMIFHCTFSSFLGGFWPSFRFYFFIRCVESHWFVWATQVSHIPMNIDLDHRQDWPSLQLAGTRNVEQSFLNDWFLGHLNFQIEHHLFPTMPRHNFQKAKPYVIEFCKKHNLDYQEKPIWTAFGDIVRSLKESGEIWAEAWDAHVPTKTKAN
jgi:fatty acid desaturase 2 (delta-6 desaturase)